MIKSFIKWAGGKSKIVNVIESLLPLYIKQYKYIDTYIEPFIGGGSFFFYLKNNYIIKKSIISDINTDLINVYKTIKHSPKELINYLQILKDEYYKLNNENKKKFYYNIRESYNNDSYDIIKKSAYFIFLNKTCFNGLFRVNKKNLFNTPIGSYNNPTIFDKKNIINISNMLYDTTILNCNYDKIINKFEFNNKTLIYLDPPYVPISKTSNFTQYSINGFTNDEQIKLSIFYKKLDNFGYKLILSNSNSELIYKLYNEFNITKIKSSRTINSNYLKRGKIHELLIRNFQ